MTDAPTATDVLQLAERYFDQNLDWVSFFREILGISGVIRQAYPTHESLIQFEQTDTYARIQQMLAKLRERQSDAPSPQEDTKVITVRLPKSLHEALREESHEYRTSMNRLCISKLIQFIDHELVPTEQYKRAAALEGTETKKEAGAGL